MALACLTEGAGSRPKQGTKTIPFCPLLIPGAPFAVNSVPC